MTYCKEIATTMAEARALWEQIRKGKKHLRFRRDLLINHEHDLRQRAAQDFAKLNGWKYSKTSFAPAQLARGSTQRKRHEAWDEGWVHDLFDHPVYFREPLWPYQPIAIVGQPYDTTVEEARITASRLGLDLHAPPIRTASWWYPGWTAFFCCTRHGTTVRFLPDQRG
jgi:hypothetical protein